MIWYCDSSAVVKRYVREVGSLWLRRELSKHDLVISQITPVEVYAALAVKRRTGALPLFSYHKARKDFAEHMKHNQYLVWPVTDTIFQLAATLVGRHPLRAYDAIQLATALDYLLDIGENLIISSARDYHPEPLEATQFHAGQKAKNFIRLNVLPISTSSRYRTVGARRRKRCNT